MVSFPFRLSFVRLPIWLSDVIFLIKFRVRLPNWRSFVGFSENENEAWSWKVPCKQTKQTYSKILRIKRKLTELVPKNFSPLTLKEPSYSKTLSDRNKIN